MDRFLIPAAVAALLAGCAIPDVFGLRTGQPVQSDSAPTVVVREIYHETPVVYVDTVYLEEEALVQPVYVEEEYNEYNETNVYVHEDVLMPPLPHRHGSRWQPRQHESRPRDRSRDGDSRELPDHPSKPEHPNVPVPRQPVRRTPPPLTVVRQQAPVPANPPDKPVPPKREAPARGGSAPVSQVQPKAPNQAPTPPVVKPAAPASDSAPVQVGINRARRK